VCDAAIGPCQSRAESRAARRLRGGRPAAPCRAEALRARRRHQVSRPAPAGRRSTPQRILMPPQPRELAGAVLLAPGILSPRKDHCQGRTSSLRCGRSTLTVIFHGKDSAPVRRTGKESRFSGAGDKSAVSTSCRYPSPAVVIFTDNSIAILGYTRHSMVSTWAKLASLIAIASRGRRVTRCSGRIWRWRT
jgi:hypothetical protein